MHLRQGKVGGRDYEATILEEVRIMSENEPRDTAAAVRSCRYTASRC